MELLEQNLLIFIIVGISIFFICITSIYFIIHHQKILDLLYKINEADKKVKEITNNQFDLINRSIGIIERELNIESKTFAEFKNINKPIINTFELDNIINESYKKIIEICNDNEKINKIKSFSSILTDLELMDVDMTSLRTFYNKYACEYNNIIRKIPYNIISNIKKYKNKGIYSGKEIDKNVL